MSGKMFLICGKICSGKSYYAEKLRREENAVILSVDEITLALFGQHLGSRHDEICGITQKYLFGKSVEILEAGCNVIFDWGFWQRDKRTYAKNFYRERNIPCELHYVDVSDEMWKQNIAERNKAVGEGRTSAYYVDDNLAEKFRSLFEEPSADEIDVRYKR